MSLLSHNHDKPSGDQPDAPPRLDEFVRASHLKQLIELAKAEDLGLNGVDVTSQLAIPVDQMGQAEIRCPGGPGRLAGLSLLDPIVQTYDPAVSVDLLLQDGQDVDTAPQPVACFAGAMRSILALERVALNFLCRLSGIASTTKAFVDAVAKTNAKIYDTRKTAPGWRGLEKYAVVCGGGHSHRMGLYDAVLIKDNHLVHLEGESFIQTVERIVTRAKDQTPPPRFVEVEVDRFDQLETVLGQLGERVDVVLLDNMSVGQVCDAVKMRDRLAPKVELEASGGIDVETVVQYAEAGVERLAVGMITHSAAAMNFGLEVL